MQLDTIVDDIEDMGSYVTAQQRDERRQDNSDRRRLVRQQLSDLLEISRLCKFPDCTEHMHTDAKTVKEARNLCEVEASSDWA